MKVTLINHSDTRGGASVVAFRLMEALRAEGVDARMLVGRKTSDSPYVEQAAGPMRTRIPFLAEHLRIFTHNGFSRKRLFQVSLATDGLPLSRHPLVREADAVMLNWVNQGLLSLKEIGRIAGMKPTLWTMHDQWNFTGICHHTGSCDRFLSHCRNCPFLGEMASKNDISSRIFDKKMSLYGSSPITFVAVSDWLARRAHESTLLGNQKVVSIPNAFPVERFAAPPAFSRAELGLPEGKKLIVFCAARIDDPGKGLADAIDVLNGIVGTHADSAVAVFVGAMRDSRALDTLRLPYVTLGSVASEKMPSIMGHAAVVLSTSPFETLSTTMIEAQSAGAVPVCYTHDGRGDIVADGVNGYSLSPASSPESHIDASPLIKALDAPVSREALRSAADRYTAREIARRYISLIQENIR